MMHAVGPWFKMRLGIVFLGFLAFLGLVGFRLVQLQIWVNPQLESLAKRQYERTGTKAAFRVPIVDRNGEELAVSVPSGSVFARPRLVTRKRDASRKLSKWLGGEPKHWLEKLRSPKPFVWLQRQVPQNVAKVISDANVAGIFVESENKRVYPNEELAAATLGFTDIDGNGLSGLELSLNDRLLPRDQRFLMVRDGKGTPSYLDRSYVKDLETPVVQTTIDRRVQHIVEDEIKRVHQETDAKAVYAVVMDPVRGDILALAQTPTFDPNHFTQSMPSVRFNSVVGGLFEPGSTIKVLLAAEALELGVLGLGSEIDCGGGEITIGNKKIREAEASHRYNRLKLPQVIALSSNVGAIRIAQALGPDRVRFAFDKFGLTSKTGITLPGEASMSSKADVFWTPFALASASFGQGISTTPLQMVAAYAPFANGGYWVKPRLLNSDMEREMRRRVLSAETAEKMRAMLVSVTEEGTAKTARVDGVKVGGKTGTAQKFVEGQGYKGGKYFSSFIGFLPAERPELLIGVMIDEPKKGYYGSELAAPLFKRIAQLSLSVLGRMPKNEVAAWKPPVRNTKVVIAPPKKEMVFEKNSTGLFKMPDLKGFSLNEAVNALGKSFSTVQVVGAGYLDEQSPPPGSWVASDSAIHLKFTPHG